MKKFIFPVLLAVTAVTLVFARPVTAQVVGPCDNSSPQFISDPVDCTAFWICANREYVKWKCPNGLYWHCVNLQCDHPWVVSAAGCCQW
ncbi:carbohydrate-binding module family 14 protein [Chitinophaga solisilvae]|uniref:carbohydrate-binding module family 14 protein n=1 Tax=Chitinophaga solisilvae TaxID=1233460 RepID=UPI0013720BB2|nr:carbohydrate-binding module family 14 protein [Chitinophaga solisilvae]